MTGGPPDGSDAEAARPFDMPVMDHGDADAGNAQLFHAIGQLHSRPPGNGDRGRQSRHDALDALVQLGLAWRRRRVLSGERNR